MEERRITRVSTIPDFDYNLSWGAEHLQESDGYTLYLGRWRVGRVQQNISPRGVKDEKWTPVNFLPGIRSEYEPFDDLDTAQSLVSGVVTFWLSRINE